jgi:predicted  nucleic acid-binding Zn-ribbon protein
VSKDVAELQQEAEILRRTIANKNEELQRVSAENGVKKKKWLEVLERVNKIGAMPRGLYSFFSHLLCIFT